MLLAKQLASLDRLSGGRLVLGVGIGAREDDYDLAGVEHAGRGRRLTEQLIDLADIFEEGRVGLRTEEHDRPQLLVGGDSPAAYARMARHADGYLHGGGPAARVHARGRAGARGMDRRRAPRACPRSGARPTSLSATPPSAGPPTCATTTPSSGPFAEKIAAGMLATPAQAIEHLHAFAEAGCDHLCLMPAVAELDQLDALADVVAEAAVAAA